MAVAQAEPTDREPPREITADPLWRMEAYRLAWSALELAWLDLVRFDADRRTRPIAAQLYRAVGSIAANIAEGYSRSSPRDRRRFMEYSLGSAREARVWYWSARCLLTEDAVSDRLARLTSVIRLLTTEILLLRRMPTKR